MFEARILSAFIASRKDYDHAIRHVDRRHWSPMGQVLLELVDDYYKNDNDAKSVDLELLKAGIDRRFRDVPKHASSAHDMLVEVLSLDTSTVNVVREIIGRKQAEIGTQLADALLSQDNERIQMYLQEYEELADTSVLEQVSQEEYVGVTLQELAAQFDDSGSWKLAPAELTDRIRGGLRPGHHVVVAARPERGKTLFGINFAAGFLAQGARVLYIGNEDPVPDLVLRMLSNLTNLPEHRLFADMDSAMAIARKRNYENCIFVGLSPGTLYEIEAVVRRYEPDVVIVDQMRNVRANTENNTQRLELVAQELRNIARRHQCVMVSMTQVGDSGRDKLELNDGDIDGSNTGIPGACDVIVMIGSNQDYDTRDLRRITLAKNKRGGDHSSFTVHIDRPTSRVASWRGLS